MILPFVELPHMSGGWPRPVLDVVVRNMGEVLMPCLVDSGALNTLLPGWVADLAGIDCADTPTNTLGVAGTGTRARMVTTSLTIGDPSRAPTSPAAAAEIFPIRVHGSGQFRY